MRRPFVPISCDALSATLAFEKASKAERKTDLEPNRARQKYPNSVGVGRGREADGLESAVKLAGTTDAIGSSWISERVVNVNRRVLGGATDRVARSAE
jgi:hypothetical protein